MPNNHKSKLSEGEKDELNRVISKVEDSLSLNEISNRFTNFLKLRTSLNPIMKLRNPMSD